jgi:hypothetical protein
MTLMYDQRRWACVAVGAALLACQSRRGPDPLEVANPGASFEVRLSGCTSRGESARRFGSSVHTALLWSRERVHNATYFPCAATIDAVTGIERHAIYRVSRTRDGPYTEQLVPRAP